MSEPYNRFAAAGGVEMAKMKQFTVTVENRPGAVSEIAKTLGR
jgi:hypothetical protein